MRKGTTVHREHSTRGMAKPLSAFGAAAASFFLALLVPLASSAAVPVHADGAMSGHSAGPLIQVAKVGADRSSFDRLRSGRSDRLVLRIQKALAEAGIYGGPVNGIMDVELRSAIRVYQKRNGQQVTGRVSEELATHLETASKVDVLLRRLDRVRSKNIKAARQALMDNPNTRHLVTDSIDEVADPTRNVEPCFRDPTARCLLTEASESAKAIQKVEMRDWALGEILASQAKAGFTEAAMTTVRRINDPRLVMVALRDIAEALATSGRSEEALAASEIIPDVFKKADALAAIAAIQAKRGDADGARKSAHRLLRVLRDVKDPGRRITFLTRAATVLHRAGDSDAAKKSIREAESLARSKLFRASRGMAFRHFAAALAEMGRPADAMLVLEEVKDPADRTAVLVATAIAQADAGDLDGAMGTAHTIATARYRAVVLSHIASAQARIGRTDEAQATLNEALEAAKQTKFPFARGFALGRIAAAFVEVGKVAGIVAFDSAVETARRITDDQSRAHALWTIAAERRRGGDAAGAAVTEALAREASKAIKSALSRVWMFGDISASHVAAGEADSAWTAFLDALGVAENVHNAWARARALSKLAATLTVLTQPAEEAKSK